MKLSVLGQLLAERQQQKRRQPLHDFFRVYNDDEDNYIFFFFLILFISYSTKNTTSIETLLGVYSAREHSRYVK